VVIFSQGLGLGGHCYYMALAAYFTAHGFLFLTYDATGTDNSEGQNCAGLEQGVIDLSRVIDYARNDPELSRYPLTLLGHSWGAYCVCAVLKLRPEIQAVAAVSGFNRPSRLFRHAFSDIAGGIFSLLVPYMRLIERFKFGSYADVTALEGFAAARAYTRQYLTEANAVLTEYGQTHTFDKKVGFAPDEEFLAGILEFYQSCLS